MALTFEEFLPEETRKPQRGSTPDKDDRKRQSGGLTFDEFMPDSLPAAPGGKAAAPTDYLGDPKNLSFEDSVSLLTWTPPARETIIRAPRPGEVSVPAPAEMQGTDQDVIDLLSQVSPEDMAKAGEAFIQTPRTREDLGLFQGKAAEVGERIGAPLTGRIIEDLANPMTIPETALLGVAGKAIKAGYRALVPAEKVVEKLPLYPLRQTARQKMFQKAEEQAKRFFPDEPDEFKVFDQLPTRAVMDAAGKMVQQPAQEFGEAEVKASVQKAVASTDGGVTAPKLTVESAKDVVNAARNLQQRNPDFVMEGDNMNRLFKRIGTAVRGGLISIDDLSPKFREAGYTREMVAELYETSATQSGQILNQLSQFARELNKAAKGRIIGMPDVPPTVWDRASHFGREMMNVWRASLVSQLATASRNFATGMAEYGLEGVNEAALAVERSLFKRVPVKDAVKPFMEHIYAIGRRFTPEGREKLAQALAQEPILTAKLYGTPVGDVTMTSKYSNLINIFNRTQEWFVRELVTDAEISKQLIMRGIDPKKQAIPREVFDNAITQALEVTKAAMPRADLGRKFVSAFSQFYPLQLAYPFPRYLANALMTLYKWSPAKPINMALTGKLAGVPAEEAMKVINRSVIGSTLMVGGAYLRGSKYAGEKWYEYRPDPDGNPGKVVDIRPFGPLLPAASFVAEFYDRLKRKEETGEPIGFEAKDYLEGTLGINRMAGTTLFSVSQLGSKNLEEKLGQIVKRFAGEFLGGFTTPFRTFRDLVAHFAPEEAVIRDVRQAPLTGPALSNIPGASQTLPEKFFATSTDNERENTLLRQTAGLTLQTKDELRQELDRLRVEPLKLEPRTGIPEMDNLARKRMGQLLEKEAPKLMRTAWYRNQKTTDAARIEELSSLISEIKKEAIDYVLERRPDFDRIFMEKEAEKALMSR